VQSGNLDVRWTALHNDDQQNPQHESNKLLSFGQKGFHVVQSNEAGPWRTMMFTWLAENFNSEVDS
jgi:hypothetical protein